MVFEDRFKNHILPDKVHMLSVSFVVPTLRREYGGCAGNVAYNLSMLGGQGFILAAVGEDFGPYFDWLAKNNISRNATVTGLGEKQMDLGLRGRVAVVTGSSQGIGKAIALGLSSEGVRVSICARNEKQLNETAREIRSATGMDVLALPADLTREDDIRRFVVKTVEAFGRIDILVNNTSGPPSATFLETSEDNWRNAVNLLLMSVVTTCLEAVPHMQERKWGRIINMTSFVAKQPADHLVLSNALRSAILGLSKTLANELAQYGILVNAVCPGWTLTKRVEELAKTQAKTSGKTPEEIVKGWESQIPLKRLAQPSEIANLVVFLASERASYMTGAVIQVDGGYTRGLF